MNTQKAEPRDAIEFINNAIQFTLKFSDKELPVLDILIKRDSTGIETYFYHKPTDTQTCLLYSLSQSKQGPKNVPIVLNRPSCTKGWFKGK